ncbi:tetratricopeptide repeat protein [Burkholderia ubonensis]|uniref:tetratricopeptide repeat protein n=1 Tax=Burkholderia ubonensis TaxID=101571 RepID=UPI0009B5435A|nr:tetratricopeptide repeat protein [Burkholderia ubonensis]
MPLQSSNTLHVFFAASITACLLAHGSPASAQSVMDRSSTEGKRSAPPSVEQRSDPICAAAAATAAKFAEIKSEAEQGNPSAQHNLGVFYWCGAGVKRDFSEAAAWYRRAAELGYAHSQFNLGELYLHGYGVQPDEASAAYWFRKAADQGNAMAQSELGQLYFLGAGVREDHAQAAMWLRKAAMQGDENAQTRIGLMLKNGFGIRQNPIAAYAWLKIAEITHPNSVVGDLDYLPELSGDALSTAEGIARHWKIGDSVPEDVEPSKP